MGIKASGHTEDTLCDSIYMRSLEETIQTERQRVVNGRGEWGALAHLHRVSVCRMKKVLEVGAQHGECT